MILLRSGATHESPVFVHINMILFAVLLIEKPFSSQPNGTVFLYTGDPFRAGGNTLVMLLR